VSVVASLRVGLTRGCADPLPRIPPVLAAPTTPPKDSAATPSSDIVAVLERMDKRNAAFEETMANISKSILGE